MQILKAYAKGYVWVKTATAVKTLKQSPLLISSIRESLVSYGNCDSKFIKEDLKKGKENLTFHVIWKKLTPNSLRERRKIQSLSSF
ncbi:hypothetical protein ANSO36C_16730 [Nostoc cf. commune SO-36]|uniref:Uncharacterized protein n=1 Tax=Nostoc cf. commune SO-36 TaxID=449208 RepID=A0ABM7YYW7_NOSCO|nr:hypothetical protein ANSO36C_16730 [Nostoc cf. commune SO-36]